MIHKRRNCFSNISVSLDPFVSSWFTSFIFLISGRWAAHFEFILVVLIRYTVRFVISLVRSLGSGVDIYPLWVRLYWLGTRDVNVFIRVFSWSVWVISLGYLFKVVFY